MNNIRLDILTRPFFVLGVILLLLNDFYFKYEYSNFLTGKLSDFAGLFIFPYFISSIRTSWTKWIYFLTFCLFIWWKSNLSQGLIEWVQSVGIGVNRTVDYSDLIALVILPISSNHFKAQLITKREVSKAFSIPVLMISVFAFLATTLPREQIVVNVDTNKSFELPISKSDFFNSITAGHPYSDTLAKNLKDTLFYLTFNIDDLNAQVTVLSIVKGLDSTKTFVKLDSVLFGDITGRLFSGVDKENVAKFKSTTPKEFEDYFEKSFINPVTLKKAEHIYYDNKVIDDQYQ